MTSNFKRRKAEMLGIRALRDMLNFIDEYSVEMRFPSGVWAGCDMSEIMDSARLAVEMWEDDNRASERERDEFLRTATLAELAGLE